LLEKYWLPEPPDVVVLGFTPPEFDLPDGFSFMTIGDMKDFPVNRWSDQLIIGLESIPDEVFIFMLEDMWITQPVYSSVVDMAYDYMQQFKYVARFDLTGDRWNAFDSMQRRPPLYGKLGHVDIVWSNPDSQYHLSTMPALWRKEHLLKALVPGETPWQVELQGTPRLSALRSEMIVIGTNAWPVRNTLAFRGGDTAALLLDEVDPTDVSEMRERGLFEGLE
jgi:hypothetical protein